MTSVLLNSGGLPLINALYRAASNRRSTLSNNALYSIFSVYHTSPPQTLDKLPDLPGKNHTSTLYAILLIIKERQRKEHKMTTARDMVTAFMQALETKDFDGAASYLSDDFYFSGSMPQPLNKDQFIKFFQELAE